MILPGKLVDSPVERGKTENSGLNCFALNGGKENLFKKAFFLRIYQALIAFYYKVPFIFTSSIVPRAA